MMDFTEEEIATVEVVFAIEATANLISHWDGIRKHYITPIIQHFNKSTGSSGDFLSNSNENMFGLVLFYTADKTPDSLTDCFPMTTNQQQFIKFVDSIDFSGGGAEHHSYIAEGLATVLQLFNDMSKAQKNKKVERFCFLVCNTPPYELPSSESLKYSGLSWIELVKELKNIDVKFSVICPQLIKELKQMFVLVNDSKTTVMNYAQDKRHLVLLTGLHIKLEKEPNPLVENVAINDTPVKSEFVMPMEIGARASEHPSVSSAAITGMSNVKSEPVPSFSQPALPQPSPTSTLNTSANAVTNVPASVSQLSTMYSSASMPNRSQESIVTSNNQSPGASTAISTRPNTVLSVNLPNPGQIADPNNKPQIDQKVMPGIAKSVNQVDPGVSFSAAEANNRLLWTGTLEWTEKRAIPPGTTITHSVSCQITQNPTNNNAAMVDPMISSNWHSKLTIQFIPTSFISQAQQLHSYLKVHKNVVLNFQPQHMQQMVAIFTKRNVHGLIQHLSPPDGKLMIVFHKKKDDKSTFFGLIPNDHAGFLKVLRNVVLNVKRRTNTTISSQIDSGQNMNQSPMQPNTVSVQDLGMNSGMQMRPQQSQQQYQYTSQPLVGQSNPQQQRLNQPINPGLNMPGPSQSHLNIRPTQAVQTIRPSIRTVGPTSNPGQLRGNQPGLPGNMGQRIIAGTTLSMPAGARPGMRMQQINSMGGTTTLAGNRQIAQGSQLRNLLGHGNSVMQASNMGMRQQDNSGLRPTGANNMQQQNFMQNPNMMSGMQNQGNF